MANNVFCYKENYLPSVFNIFVDDNSQTHGDKCKVPRGHKHHRNT